MGYYNYSENMFNLLFWNMQITRAFISLTLRISPTGLLFIWY